MRALALILLAAAGGALTWVALRAPERDHQALRPGYREGQREHLPAAITAPAPEGVQLVRLRVEGTCCEGCLGKLYDALLATEGVTRAAVRLDGEAAEAQAWLPQDADPQGLAAVLTFDKYAANVHE